jgi:hypothetical protein
MGGQSRGSEPDTEAKRELFRLTFARSDIRLAKTLCSWLAEHPTGSDIHSALWTALAVCYARPFSKNNIGALAGRWQRFDDERLKRTHDTLISARNRDFAHTDKSPARAVYVHPPGAMTERGSAATGDIPFAREVLKGVAALCDAQIERLGERIEELVEQLYGGEEWPEGTQIELDYPEECSFCGRVLEHPWQERAGRNRAFICSTCVRDAALELGDDAWPDWFRRDDADS